MSILEAARQAKQATDEAAAKRKEEESERQKAQLVSAVENLTGPLSNYKIVWASTSMRSGMPNQLWVLKVSDEPLKFAINDHGELVVLAYLGRDHYRRTSGERCWHPVKSLEDLASLSFPPDEVAA